MSGDIIWESGTFLYALWWGMVLAFQYDTIRIIRRIIRHRRVFMIAVEDVIYWIYVGIRIFIICFYVNSGIIRSFIVVGLVCGVVLYLKALSVYYIKYGVRLVGILLKPLKMLVSVIRIVLQSLRKDRPNRLMKKNSVQKSLMNIRSMCRRRSLRRRLPRINLDLYIQMR